MWSHFLWVAPRYCNKCKCWASMHWFIHDLTVQSPNVFIMCVWHMAFNTRLNVLLIIVITEWNVSECQQQNQFDCIVFYWNVLIGQERQSALLWAGQTPCFLFIPVTCFDSATMDKVRHILQASVNWLQPTPLHLNLYIVKSKWKPRKPQWQIQGKQNPLTSTLR